MRGRKFFQAWMVRWRNGCVGNRFRKPPASAQHPIALPLNYAQQAMQRLGQQIDGETAPLHFQPQKAESGPSGIKNFFRSARPHLDPFAGYHGSSFRR
jgi:hypothetical protein